MNITKLFSSRERTEILKSVICLDSAFGVNETAKRLKLSKGLLSKYFAILLKENLLKKKGKKFIVGNNHEVKGVKIMLNLQKINTNIFKKYKCIDTVGLYGSSVKGTNTVKSDVDLWIKLNKAQTEEIAELTSELRNKIENAKILVIDDKKIGLLKSKDPLFYYSLYFGSIILYGEDNGL